MLADVFLCSRENKHTRWRFFFCILYVFERVIGIIGTVINLLEIKWWCLKLALDQLLFCALLTDKCVNQFGWNKFYCSAITLLSVSHLFVDYVIYGVRLEVVCNIILSLLKIVIIRSLFTQVELFPVLEIYKIVH